MKRVLLFTFAFLSANVILYGQNLKKGYIVTYENDTISGIIKEEVNFKDRVSFKRNDDQFQEYSTEKVKAFSLNNEKFYETITLTDDTTKEVKIFGLVLAKGFSTLYLSTEKKKDIYYLKIKNELIKMTKNDSVGNFKETAELFHRDDNKYIGILTHYLSDCETIKNSISNTTFSAPSLSRLIHKYNKCVSPETKDELYEKANPIKFHFGAKFGYGTRSLKFLDPNSPQRHLKFDRRTGYTFGAFINFTYKNIFALQPELLVNKKGATGTRVFYGTTEVENKVNIAYLQIPVNFIYSVPLRYFQPYIKGGLVLGLPLESELYETYPNHNGEFRKKTIPYGKLNEIGVRYGFGGKLKIDEEKKLLLEVIFEKTFASRGFNEIALRGISFQTGIEF